MRVRRAVLASLLTAHDAPMEKRENMEPKERASLEAKVRAALVGMFGESVEITSRGAKVALFLTRLSLGVILRAAVHGLKQKVGDSVSSFKGKSTAEIAKGMQETIDTLYSGEWTDQTARIFSVARGVLMSAYPKAEIPARGEWSLRDDRSLAFWCERMHTLYPSEKLPQGPQPKSVLAKAEKIIRERDAAAEDLA